MLEAAGGVVHPARGSSRPRPAASRRDRRDPLYDGGLADNAPISKAVALGATRVFVLRTGTPAR